MMVFIFTFSRETWIVGLVTRYFKERNIKKFPKSLVLIIKLLVL